MYETHKRLFAILDAHKNGIGDTARASLTQALVLLLDEVWTDWNA